MTSALNTKTYRKAYASQGDDMRARFVRVPATDVHKPRNHKPRLPGFEAAFVQEGRTKFPKRVLAPTDRILVSGHCNIKIGKTVRKGRLRGYEIFTLSLEERKTCPRSCQHWQTCYGNNMPFAKRVDHTHVNFLRELDNAVAQLCRRTAKRGTGILVRLHALGDFFSVPYVWFWRERLHEFPNLAIYGYTARSPKSGIGLAVDFLNRDFPGRSMVRFSNGAGTSMNTVTIATPASKPAHAFVCPEQTGKTLGCDTCALCWSTGKTVAFLEH